VIAPAATPERGPASYAFPKTTDGLLDWAEAEARLREARGYWVATTNASGDPHVRPVWGVWVDRSLFFDGHPATRWARNIARDPRVSVHLDDTTNVVIVDGRVADVQSADAELSKQIVDAWRRKYGKLAPDPAGRGIFRLHPVRVRAWSEHLRDATRWTFAA
jgi:pyridoxine/pyridoxamine 5'-phosphate oxidase